MVRKAIVALAGLALAGCEGPIDACEREIIEVLKAPSTYDRISASRANFPQAPEPFISVTIEYDAENSFGAPIRHTAECKVPLVEGEPSLDAAHIQWQYTR